MARRASARLFLFVIEKGSSKIAGGTAWPHDAFVKRRTRYLLAAAALCVVAGWALHFVLTPGLPRIPLRGGGEFRVYDPPTHSKRLRLHVPVEDEAVDFEIPNPAFQK